MIEPGRLRLRESWPVHVAVLGVALPISFLRGIDGLILNNGPLALAKILANAAAIDALLSISIALVLAAVARLGSALLKSPAGVLYPKLCVQTARLIVAVFLVHATLYWLHAVNVLPYLPADQLSLLIIVPAAVGLAWYARVRPHAGSLLIKLRPLAIGMAAFAAVGGALLATHGFASAPRMVAAAYSGAATPRHIVLLTIDTLSASHLSLYGYDRETSPNLDRFAQHARVFDRFYANGNWTTPGMASLATGRRPWTTRAGSLDASPLAESAIENVFSLARDAGYATAAFIANPNGSAAHLGIAEAVQAAPCGLTNHLRWSSTDCVESLLGVSSAAFNITLTAHLLTYAPVSILSLMRFHDAGALFEPRMALEPARRWLETHRNEPALIWIHVLPPHDPYVAPQPFRGVFDPSQANVSIAATVPPYGFNARGHQLVLDGLVARYDESIRYVDSRIGEFLDGLEADPDLSDSIVIVSADHGESFHHEFGGHGGIRLSEEVIRIPMMIFGPGIAPGRESGLHEQVDVLPTVAALIGRQPDIVGHFALEGHALPIAEARVQDSGADIFSMSLEQVPRRGPLSRGAIAMIRGPYKYVHYFGKPRYPNMPELIDELYDVLADPREDHNLIGTRPEVEQPMLKAIRAEIDARH